jgi:hypothetical protein
MTDAEGESTGGSATDATDGSEMAESDAAGDEREDAAGTVGTGDLFEIPARPERRFPTSGGMEYEGETVFTLAPDPPADDETLTRLVERVLDDEPYTYGDWFDLPMPLFLVHDEETTDVFRVAVRDGRVELHVLPATESPGLRGLYDRLRAADGDRSWQVDCRIAAE